MKTIIIDDELWAMEKFEIECSGIAEINLVGKFNSSLKALEFAQKNKIEFALLDIEMPEMNGIELATKLKELYPQIIIVFVTGYDSYIGQASRIDADYYLMKPYNSDQVQSIIKRAKLLSARQKKPLFIRTFGQFDVFYNGKAVPFPSAKAKEFLAVLVDKNGGWVTTEEAFSLMWEDKPFTDANYSLCRKAALRLKEILSDVGISDIIIESNGGRSLDRRFFDCDYYDFLNNDAEAVGKFNYQYMNQYSWGEETLATLTDLKDKADTQPKY